MDSNKRADTSSLLNTVELSVEKLAPRGEERREYRRRPARWPATLLTQDKVLVNGKTRDVSEMGVSITTPVNFIKGALVLIEINIFYKSIKKPIRVRGEVRHSAICSDGFTLGILFKDIAEPVQKFLKKYAEEQI